MLKMGILPKQHSTIMSFHINNGNNKGKSGNKNAKGGAPGAKQGIKSAKPARVAIKPVKTGGTRGS